MVEEWWLTSLQGTVVVERQGVGRGDSSDNGSESKSGFGGEHDEDSKTRIGVQVRTWWRPKLPRIRLPFYLFPEAIAQVLASAR